MNSDDLERRLSRIPFRPPPAHWRDDLLAAARTEAPADHRTRPSSLLADFGSRVRGLVSRLAAPWPVLAGAWAVIGMLNAASAWLAPATSAALPMASSSMSNLNDLRDAVRAHRAEIIELVRGLDSAGPAEPPDAPRPPKRGDPDRPEPERNPFEGKSGAKLESRPPAMA